MSRDRFGERVAEYRRARVLEAVGWAFVCSGLGLLAWIVAWSMR